jgi:hypothetical protein
MNAEAHVVPVDDVLDHEISDNCICGPESTPVKQEDGSMGWVMTHHALDGRESGE